MVKTVGSNGHKKILVGRKEIMDYIGCCDKNRFYEWIKNGLPARVINSRWYGHVDNINQFFRVITVKPDGNVDLDAD
jgi:hypothetical protein